MTELYNLTVAEAAERVRKRQVSPVDLAKSLLDRIDTQDQTLGAWVTVDREGVLRAARHREQQVYERGSLGPIHGVPVGVKDIFYTAGLKTEAGSRICVNFVPVYDATAVIRLKQAGGIVLGKTVTPEFASGDYVLTGNPWNLDHTPGGSSTGSAVAVASRMCPAALGSQTGGSISRPASFNGVVGLKPTYGRISRYGVLPVSWSLDTIGILVRTVEDAAIMLNVLAGHDSCDPGSSTLPVDDYSRDMISTKRPPRIGLARGFFLDRSSLEVRKHVINVASLLARAGAMVEEIDLPDSFTEAHSCHNIIMLVERAAYHEEVFRCRADEYTPKVRASIEAGLQVPGVKYLQAQHLRQEFCRDMAELVRSVDVILTPATPEPAYRARNTTGNPAFGQPWTSSGLPTIVIPSGLSRSGLPLSVQLSGRHFEEGKLLAAASWCEAVLGVLQSPPDHS
jgi:aspartyl-tRNA(Asn)/glutamyl-tRNA(Gln) amidotransferase subunit A